MFDYVLERIAEGNSICYKLPTSLRDAWADYVYKKPMFDRVRISRPVKRRTTGEGSQNHHINGHVQQIAQETGNDFSTVKQACKEEAISAGYPFDTFGERIIPWSETRINTEQAGILIDTIHRIAAEMGVMLNETSET